MGFKLPAEHGHDTKLFSMRLGHTFVQLSIERIPNNGIMKCRVSPLWVHCINLDGKSRMFALSTRFGGFIAKKEQRIYHTKSLRGE